VVGSYSHQLPLPSARCPASRDRGFFFFGPLVNRPGPDSVPESLQHVGEPVLWPPYKYALSRNVHIYKVMSAASPRSPPRRALPRLRSPPATQEQPEAL
jgi:hypothetical protein